MKKLVLTLALGLFATGAFAQKSNLKAAEKLAQSNPKEARELVKQAMTNEETKDDAQTYYVAALIEHEAFKKGLKEMENQEANPNKDEIFGYLLGAQPMWKEVLRLDQLPNEKGKVKPRFESKVQSHLREDYGYLLQAGDYFLNNKNYPKAIEAFEAYLAIKEMPLFAKDPLIVAPDEASNQVKYILVAAAYESKLYDKAIANALKSKDHPTNADEIQQLIGASYLAKADTTAALQAFEEGAQKFPKQSFYLGNIVNIYAQRGQLDAAVDFLKKAIEADPQNIGFISAMGSLLERKEDFAGAMEAYKQALSLEPDNFEANYNLGRLYYNEAVTYLNAEVLDALTKSKAEAVLKKALPYLEAAYAKEQRQVYYVLGSVYNQLGMSDKYEKVMADNQ